MMPDLSQSCRRTSSRKDVPEMIFKDGDFNKPLDPLQSFDWVLLQTERECRIVEYLEISNYSGEMNG